MVKEGDSYKPSRSLRVYAFDFAVTVRPRAGRKKKSKIEKSQLTLREKVGFGRFQTMGIGGVSIAAAGENFDEFEPRNAISLWEIDNLRV